MLLQRLYYSFDCDCRTVRCWQLQQSTFSTLPPWATTTLKRKQQTTSPLNCHSQHATSLVKLQHFIVFHAYSHFSCFSAFAYLVGAWVLLCLFFCCLIWTSVSEINSFIHSFMYSIHCVQKAIWHTLTVVSCMNENWWLFLAVRWSVFKRKFREKL